MDENETSTPDDRDATAAGRDAAGDNDLDQDAEEVRSALDDLDRHSPLASVEFHSILQSYLQNVGAEQLRANSAIGEALKQFTAAYTLRMPMIDLGLFKKLDLPTSSWVRAMAAWAPSFRALSMPSAYSSAPAPATSYSSDMTSPGSYFEPHEVVVSSFEDLNAAIVKLISKADSFQLVWRGQQVADWGMASSLFRRLKSINDVEDPGPGVLGEQPYPTESQMVAAEAEILRVARSDWRLDGMSALETFARIQHAGGTSRFIDVTKNPFIAAWFACENHDDHDDKPARLFAFATTAPLRDGHRHVPGVAIGLDREWSDYEPPWHRWDDTDTRRRFDWGTGSRRRLWVPPAYDSRIAAQNAAFLLDGVPLPAAKAASYFKTPSQGYWTRADMLAAGSIYMKTASPKRKPQPNKFNFAPTFTFQITAGAKAQIRKILTDRFGYTTSYIYPDVAKLADYVSQMDLPTLDDVG